jgi:UDP-N-acetylmuramoyl-L-alanyl-D-glutamate--2,6-diaminopimelate ligase
LPAPKITAPGAVGVVLTEGAPVDGLAVADAPIPFAPLKATTVSGVEPDVALDALARFGGVAGRFEPVAEGQPFAVVVDFARTPRPRWRPCCAPRARSPATAWSARSGVRAAIVEDIRPGDGRERVVEDRKAAIRAALTGAAPGELVLIDGRCHEVIQLMGHGGVPFDDAEAARRCLRAGAPDPAATP